MKKGFKIGAFVLSIVLCMMLFCACKEDTATSAVRNLDTPNAGDTIAVLHTSMGDITVEFFDDVAPKAVENFLTHAEEGYYDNLLFHRVIDNFMIQSGDPNGDGTGGESIWGDPFENEISDNAYNLRGALCMANRSDTVSNGSQFYIVQADVVSESQFTTYESYGYTFTDTQKELYEQYGGAPWLDGDYTVFGQVIDGMDVVDAIAAVSVDTSNKPLEDVVLESIEVTTYTAE